MASVASRIRAAFALSLVVILAISAIGFSASRRLTQTSQATVITSQFISELADLSASLQLAQAGSRGYIISGDQAYLDEYRSQVDATQQSFDRLKARAADDLGQLALLAALQTKLTQALRFLESTHKARERGGIEAVSELYVGGAAIAVQQDARRAIRDIRDDADRVLHLRQTAAQNAASMSSIAILVAAFVGFATLIPVSIVLGQSIATPLGVMARQTQIIADGDLAVTVEADRGPREIKILAQSFASMVDALRNTANMAQNVAAGDLSTQVIPRSDKDVLGQALARMISALQQTSAVARKIADGDLTSEIQPRSDRDMLGISLGTMAVNLRTAVAEIQGAANVLALSSSEISTAVSQVAASVAQTANAVTETTTTVEEVRQTSVVADERAQAVLEASQNTSRASELGHNAVKRTVDAMDDVRNQMQRIAQTTAQLTEQSQSIANIINTVNDLAEQSNLLAVNAAIQAAQAADQGKGFSVVADEIRSLAQQSKQATLDVAAILEQLRKSNASVTIAIELGSKSVDAAVKQAEHTRDAMQQLDQFIHDAQDAAAHIAASNRQQAAGTSQLAQAIESIAAASEENKATAGQIDRSARTLHDAGQRLRDLVDRYAV